MDEKMRHEEKGRGRLLPLFGILMILLLAVIIWTLVPGLSAIQVRLVCVGSVVCMAAVAAGSYLWFRGRYVRLTEDISDTLERMIAGKNVDRNVDLETLSSRIAAKVQKLGEITNYAKGQEQRQKQEIQQMVSDISHQLKTPIANIKMYSDTVSASDRLGEEEQQFLRVMKGQVQKLEFLIQSLIKMSRLESNLIVLKKENLPIFSTLSRAVSSMIPAAEKKKIQLEVHCPEELRLFHDPKWTEEAIFNVLDNAVKYTPPEGKIKIQVEARQIYTMIAVTDTGIGIAPEHKNDIFKRFYREETVHKEPGVGIGLYLTREILSRQAGYVTVQSKVGAGSTFSLFLSNERCI